MKESLALQSHRHRTLTHVPSHVSTVEGGMVSGAAGRSLLEGEESGGSLHSSVLGKRRRRGRVNMNEGRESFTPEEVKSYMR